MSEPEHICPENNHPDYYAVKMHDGLWWLDDVYEGEIQDVGILFCPFCGEKLQTPIIIEMKQEIK